MVAANITSEKIMVKGRILVMMIVILRVMMTRKGNRNQTR